MIFVQKYLSTIVLMCISECKESVNGASCNYTGCLLHDFHCGSDLYDLESSRKVVVRIGGMYVISTIVIPRPITMHIRVLFRTAFPFQFWASVPRSFNSLHMGASLNPQDLQRHTFCQRDDFILLARTDTVLKLLGNHSNWLLTNDQTQTDLRTQSHIIDCYVSLLSTGLHEL